MEGYSIDIHQHQSPNVEDTDTNTSTNHQHYIVDIKPTDVSYSGGSTVGEDSQEGTDNTDEEVESTLWFRMILPLLLLFRKVSISFIFVFEKYLAINEMMMIFAGKSSQNHRMRNKLLKEVYKWFVTIYSITSYIGDFTPEGLMVGKEKKVTK